MARFRSILIAMALLAIPATARADFLVIRSVGADAKPYAMGSKIKAGRKIKLGKGSIVDLINEDGTYSLKGPGRWEVGRKTLMKVFPDGHKEKEVQIAGTRMIL